MRASRTNRFRWPWQRAAVAVAAVALGLHAPGISAQTGVITGQVLDAQSGAPVGAAQVFIPELSIGVLSQPDGSFTLVNVPAGLHEVQAQRLGFTTATQQVSVTADGTATVDFNVSRDALELDAVVVTGTAGGTRTRAIGNVVGRVQATEIAEIAPIGSIQDLLGGRESGLMFHRQSGNIGTGSEMRIRGVSSVTMGSQPLIYVDGIRVDNETAGGPNLRDGRQVATLDDFSPEEIESVEIIKGPAAATLYGTEASAGVIQIITKKGAQGRPQFDLSVRQGATWLADLSDKVGLAYGRDDAGNLISFNIYEVEKAAGRDHFQTGSLQSYTASMRGGTDQVRYYLSADFDDDEGIVSYNWQKQTNLRSNVTVLASEDITLDVSLGYITGETSFMQQRTAWGMWEQFQWANPEGQGRTLRGFLRARPEEIAENKAIRDMTRFTGSATVTHTPFPWLTQRAIIGTDVLTEENSVLFPRRPEGANHDFGGLSLGDLNLERPRREYNTLDYSASANYSLNDAITLTSSFGFQYYARTEEVVGGIGRVFPAPQIVTLSGAAATTATQTYVENKSVGMYVQQEVAWNDRIFLTAAVRGDDNSAFGADYDAAIYPKFSATWVISEEPFWQQYDDIVNSLRLRSAWGKAGRQPDTFAGVTLFRPEPGPGGEPSVSPDVLGNPDLGPEVSQEIEVGFDAAFFDERMSTEFTYYNQLVTDALIDVPVPPTFGFPGAQTVNLGELKNTGWELAVEGRLYERPNLAWDMGFGIQSNENEIVDLGGVPETNDLKEGWNYPLMTERIIRSAELDQHGNAINVMCDGGGGQDGLVPGVGNALVPCSTAPLLVQGNGLAIPKYEASMNTTITLFDNLRLFAMAEWRGEHWRSLTDAACRHTCFQTSYMAVTREDPFFVAALTGRARQTRITSDFDAAFLKLRELSLNYTLPSAWAERAGASRASVNVAFRNPWTIWVAQSEISGAPVTDPEARRVGDLDSSNSNVPPLTSFTATMRVSF